MKFASAFVYLLLITACVHSQKTIVYPKKKKKFDQTCRYRAKYHELNDTIYSITVTAYRNPGYLNLSLMICTRRTIVWIWKWIVAKYYLAKSSKVPSRESRRLCVLATKQWTAVKIFLVLVDRLAIFHCSVPLSKRKGFGRITFGRRWLLIIHA